VSQVGDVGRRAGQRYPTDDGCVDTMDAQWHSFSTWLTEAQLSMAKMTQERKVLEDRIASAQNRERDLAGELSSLQKQFKALTDQQAKLALKEKQAVYEKKALQQLVKAGTAASLGLINVKSSAAAAAAVSDADAAEVAAMRHVSKLPQLQAMLEEIEASSPLGDGLKQLEERVGAMNAKIRKVEAKEEELICVVETTLEQLDAIYTVIDEVRSRSWRSLTSFLHQTPTRERKLALAAGMAKRLIVCLGGIRTVSASRQVQRVGQRRRVFPGEPDEQGPHGARCHGAAQRGAAAESGQAGG
jgi:chromosome segregation ATPase